MQKNNKIDFCLISNLLQRSQPDIVTILKPIICSAVTQISEQDML